MLCDSRKSGGDQWEHELTHRRRMTSLAPLAEVLDNFLNVVQDEGVKITHAMSTNSEGSECIQPENENVMGIENPCDAIMEEDGDFPFVLTTPDMISESNMCTGPPSKKVRLTMRPSRKRMTMSDFKEDLYSLEMLSIPIL